MAMMVIFIHSLGAHRNLKAATTGGNSFQGHKSFHLSYLAHELVFTHWRVWLTDGKDVTQWAERSVNFTELFPDFIKGQVVPHFPDPSPLTPHSAPWGTVSFWLCLHVFVPQTLRGHLLYDWHCAGHGGSPGKQARSGPCPGGTYNLVEKTDSK